MKELLQQLRIAVVATLALAVVCCGLYPLVVWAAGQALFPDAANGSLVRDRSGKVVGSRLIGQAFAAPRYFQSRPSAAGKGYDATNSGGSNLGPLSAKLMNGAVDDPATKDVDESFVGIRQRVAAYRRLNGLAPDVKIPVDAVTASASGLDPHISPENAALQVSRVARERGLSEDGVRTLVRAHTSGPDLGLFGDPAVDVLTLNLALDAASSPP